MLRHRWLYLILLLALVLRTYHLTDPPWDYHNWRQTITLMVARDFARHGFPLLHPQVAWVGNDPAGPSPFSGEFSIQSIVAALLYKIFGESEIAARIVVIAFSLLGIFFLYDLLRRRAGELAAGLGALVYALLPYHLFFGRVFMPDVPALTLALGGLAWLDRWTDDRKWRTLLIAASLCALAILQKLTVVFIALPAFYLFWLALRQRLLARLEPYIFAAIVAVPSYAWYSHSAAIGKGSGFAIMQPFNFATHLSLWFQPPFLRDILKALTFEAFSPIGLGLAAVGLFWPALGKVAWMFRLWVAGAAALLLLSPDLLPANHYYLALLLPGGAALAGLALAKLASDRKTYPLLALVLGFFAAGAIWSALPFYQPDRWPYELGTLLNRLTAPTDLLITESGGSPNILYFADRRGWLRDRAYDAASLDQEIKQGARYYADVFVSDTGEQREFFTMMSSRFERLPSDAKTPWPIYRLTPP